MMEQLEELRSFLRGQKLDNTDLSVATETDFDFQEFQFRRFCRE